MVLPDYLEPGLDVVFCGTAAGSRSATAGHYYAGPGNRFWQMLADTGLTPKLLGPADDARLTRYGIGLTDLVKFNSGADSTLTGDMFDVARFERQVIRCAPRYVAFNGKKAAQIALRLRSGVGIDDGTREPFFAAALGLLLGHFEQVAIALVGGDDHELKDAAGAD